MSLKELAKKVKKENKEANKSFEERFLEAVDNWLVANAIAEEDEDDTRPDKRVAIKPSSYYKCIRRTCYELWGTSKKNRKKFAKSERTLAIGTITHEWVQWNVFMKMSEEGSGISLIPVEELPLYGVEGIELIFEHKAPPMEVKFVDRRWTEKYPISAMLDGALEFLGRRFVFEFKTCKSSVFEYLIEPLKEHLKQGALYSLCTGLPVMFLYINKDTQEWKAFFVEYTQDQLDWAENRVKLIDEYASAGELPDKEEGEDCRWCPYKHLCSEDIVREE